MASAALDTLSASRRLRDAGFDERQAEAVARLVADRSDELSSNSITPLQLSREFAVVRTEIRADNDVFRAEMRADNEQFRAEMRSDNEQFRAEMRADNERVLVKMQAEMLALRVDMNAGFALLRAELQAGDQAIRLELEKRVGGVERDTLVLKWMMGFMLAGLLALLMRAFADIILR